MGGFSLGCACLAHSELDFLILCRCFLSKMWLVLSCMSMAACLHDKCSMFLQNLEDGVDRSMSWRQGNLGDFMNCLVALSLVFLELFV